MTLPTKLLLEKLTAARMRELARSLGINVAERGSKPALTAALAAAPFLNVAGAMTLLELKAVCAKLCVKPKKGESNRATLVTLIAKAANGAARPASASAAPVSAAAQAGTLKAALRRFAVDAPSFSGRDAGEKFVTALLASFGWADGRPPNAQIPGAFRVVDHRGTKSTRKVAALWPERRVLIEVVDADASLEVQWKDLLRACLQVEPVPQYALLTNLRDLHFYDLGHGRDAPRLRLSIDDLAKHSEAFPFLSRAWVPGSTPKIVNVGKVSREVADLVARLYRSLKQQHPRREADVIAFTLQCIITMFAEDIGLLPREHFTSLLYDGARHSDVEKRLAELFRVMSTRDVPAPRPVSFFNGGLFRQPVTVPLGDAQLAALTRAAEANWQYVDPHIFGSVFQGIMDDEERHATGAHYTAHDDIMRVVGPTILEPWRKRIGDATTLQKLLELRDELFRFRILDPACGSGNFLYVSFRELYRLDTELLGRIRQFPSASGVAWSLGIPTSNFYGLDTNRFAVELAKVTLNIAKKIAFEERRESMAALGAQLGFDVDPSLPLDNLDRNIVCADALFTDWPEVNAIVGNPPMLGDRKMRKALGQEYLTRLQATSGVRGVVDLSCYWFRRAHDRLPRGGRAGLVGTSGVRVGKAREASLDYIVENGGTITNAVSSTLWPGEAALDVSMVNWIKAPAKGSHTLVVDNHSYSLTCIPTHLQLLCDTSTAKEIKANNSGTAMGVIFGHEEFRSSAPPDSKERFMRPVATGDDMLRGTLATTPDYCIYLAEWENEADAKKHGGRGFEHLSRHVYPFVKERAQSEDTHHFARWLRTWWQPREPSSRFFRPLAAKHRFIACSSPQARPIFAFLSTSFVPTNTMQAFALDDDYSFGIIQSGIHWQWLMASGGKVRQDIRYTSRVWETFPWPQDPPEAAVAEVAEAGRNLRAVREKLMAENSWTLRALHQAADIEGTHPLNDAQRALDASVANVYGVPSGQDPGEFLLELNRCLVEDEEQGRPACGPGLPQGLNPSDRRWSSADCIQPPPLAERARHAAIRR